jgi:hypothetical protein
MGRQPQERRTEFDNYNNNNDDMTTMMITQYRKYYTLKHKARAAGITLVQEKYQGEMDCDNRQQMMIIMMMIPGRHKIKELQKTVILGTACILRKC